MLEKSALLAAHPDQELRVGRDWKSFGLQISLEEQPNHLPRFAHALESLPILVARDWGFP